MKSSWLFLCLLASAAAFGSALPTQPHVYVEGSAQIEVEPDQLTITVGLSATDEVLAVAKENVDTRSRALIERLQSMGVDRKDIGATALQIRPQFEQRDGERTLIGTRAYRQVDITLRDLSLYTELMNALVEADIANTVTTRFSVSESPRLTDEALAMALADAKARAERLAAAEGKRLGDVYSISEFKTRGEETYSLYPSRRVVGQSTMSEITVMAGSVSSGGEPFEPGMMLATARVYVVYLLH